MDPRTGWPLHRVDVDAVVGGQRTLLGPLDELDRLADAAAVCGAPLPLPVVGRWATLAWSGYDLWLADSQLEAAEEAFADVLGALVEGITPPVRTRGLWSAHREPVTSAGDGDERCHVSLDGGQLHWSGGGVAGRLVAWERRPGGALVTVAGGGEVTVTDPGALALEWLLPRAVDAVVRAVPLSRLWARPLTGLRRAVASAIATRATVTIDVVG